MTPEEQKALGMPEKIYCIDNCGQPLATVWSDNDQWENGVEYVRLDVHEALEAENKMLAEAVLGLASKDIHVSRFAPTTHAEAIALAQRIGGK